MIGQTSQSHIHRTNQIQNLNQRKGYEMVNAYTHKPAFQQIFAIITMTVIVVMHAVFITTATATLQSSILWVLVAVTYALLIIIIYDYIFLTCTDPVDDLILKIDKNYKQADLMICAECKSSVHYRSHHCHTCLRCVQDFDHHCKYLNNCIGGKNYSQFLRMLLTLTAFCITIMGEGIWIVIAAQQNFTYSGNIISQWGALVTLILAFIALIAVDSLLCFHFYLIFWLKQSTYDYIKKQWENQPDPEPEVQINEQVAQ